VTGDNRALEESERRIEEWTDERLVDEYRRLKGELADGDASADAVEKEMKRRGLTPDRENVIPDAGSPTRDPERTPVSRGTAPDAGEDTSG
jgi:hypothetical protein